jgi:Sulfotransferase domain
MGKIIWLASYPKSGNTWLRAFLHNLLRDPEEGYDLNKMSDFTVGDTAGMFYQKFLRKPVKEMTEDEVSILRPKVQEMITRSSPDNVFVKTHNALVSFLDRPLIHMEHTAGAIYVVRNPLDMVISHADHYGKTIDDSIEIIGMSDSMVMTGEHNVHEIHCSWSRHVESWTANPHRGLHVMRYEDMHARPLETFGGLVQFLRLPVERARLERSIRLSSFKELRRKEEEKGFIERSEAQKRFFRQGKAGGWREVLTPEQVERMAAKHEQQMRRFGYWPIKDWNAPRQAAALSA